MATSPLKQRSLRDVEVPEQHFLPPSDYCPNNPMPILIYRNFFKEPRDAEAMQAYVESNGWTKTVRLTTHLRKHGRRLLSPNGFNIV
jgi:hypothetical protein